MSDNCLPKQLLYGELYSGKRAAGGQKKRFKGCLKFSLKDLDIDVSTRENLATNRTAWRSKVRAGVSTAELRRITAAEQKR